MLYYLTYNVVFNINQSNSTIYEHRQKKIIHDNIFCYCMRYSDNNTSSYCNINLFLPDIFNCHSDCRSAFRYILCEKETLDFFQRSV